eukprot:COSAG04_NODE_23346_length_340_cov_0.647303_1_plen_20_part_10
MASCRALSCLALAFAPRAVL